MTQSTVYADTTSVTVDNLKYTINEQSKTATVVGLSDTVSSNTYIAVIIPATISNGGNKYKVTKIGNYAFYANKTQKDYYKEINDKIASVIFEEGSELKNIGNFAFCGCNKLRTINIPAGVELIGTQAFKECSRLTTITFEEGSKLNAIGKYAFSMCNMSTITIPASVTRIEGDAFYFCSNLTKVTFEDGSKLETIGNSTFENCNKLATINFGGTKEQWDTLNVTLPTLTTGTTTVNCKETSDSASGTGESSGDGGGTSIQKPTVVTPTNGTITILSDGTTAVIRPNEGYEIVSVLLNGHDEGTFPVLMNLKSSDKVEATFQKTKETLGAEAKAAVASLSTMAARSTKTAKGNIKVVAKLSTAEKAKLAELTDLGYTVKYHFYRSTKKSSDYKAMLEGTTGIYYNTIGTDGVRYFYKCQIRVYDANGTLVAKTALKNCKYACRKF